MAAMTVEPALLIERFANGDPVEPRLQRAAPAESANSAKGFQKNFLRGVGGVRHIAQHPENEVIDRAVVVGDEPVEGRLRTGLKLGHQFGLVPAPGKDACPIGHCRPFRSGALAGPSYGRPRPGRSQHSGSPRSRRHAASAQIVRHRGYRECFPRFPYFRTALPPTQWDGWAWEIPEQDSGKRPLFIRTPARLNPCPGNNRR